MAKIQVEVDEVEYANQRRLTALYGKMMSDPKAREQLTRAAKLVNPQAVTPELDAKDEVLAALETERQERLALQAQLAADKAEREQEKALAQFSSGWEAQKAQLRKEGWQDEGIEKVEEHAKTLGIANLSVAAAPLENITPAPQVAQSSGFAPFDSFHPSERDSENFKALMANGGQDDPMLENKMIREALDDYRSGRTR